MVNFTRGLHGFCIILFYFIFSYLEQKLNFHLIFYHEIIRALDILFRKCLPKYKIIRLLPGTEKPSPRTRAPGSIPHSLQTSGKHQKIFRTRKYLYYCEPWNKYQRKQRARRAHPYLHGLLVCLHSSWNDDQDSHFIRYVPIAPHALIGTKDEWYK